MLGYLPFKLKAMLPVTHECKFAIGQGIFRSQFFIAGFRCLELSRTSKVEGSTLDPPHLPSITRPKMRMGSLGFHT